MYCGPVQVYSLQAVTVISDSSDEETPGRRSKRSGVLKTDKVNAKGETLLHQNCISGNLGKVRSLLAEVYMYNELL
jgi:hypothetical protein